MSWTLRDEGCYVPLHWHKDIELNLILLGNAAPPAGVPGFEPKVELITIASV